MNATMEKNRKYKLVPTFGDSYGTGWNVMLDNFLRLLLVVFVLGILTGPMKGINFKFDAHDFKNFPWHWEGDWEQIFGLASVGAFAVFIGLIALAYTFLALPVVRYGAKMIFVQSVRKVKKLDPIESVELSWKLTRGHGWTIFLMGFVSFFIYIFGFILLFVGIFPAIMWVKSTFATLYQSVLNEKEIPVEAVAA
jgi:hypothetical protein